MAILWERSLTPWLDANGDPYSGLQAYFFDAGTLTPIVTYTDASLSIPNDHPVVANSGGMFPPIFLPEQITYRVRILEEGGSTIWDVDNISAPTTVVPDPPSGGTDTQYLVTTGFIYSAWRTSAPDGSVRCNGRSIGGASSGATERANADCQDLFLLLWTEDSTLAVSGGRGATAAGDWAASKTISLPDLRGRALVGLDGMGSFDAGRVVDGDATGGDSNVLGASGGENRHALSTPELASHTHAGTTDAGGNHGHPIRVNTGLDASSKATGGIMITTDTTSTLAAFTGTPSNTLGEQIGGSGTHTHTFTSASTGTGTAHNNLQPFAMVNWFIKL